jgi:pSer/pThr/pTyr-binding forkhead associated (FHA) protein
MAKLIFLLDGNVIREYALEKERFTIGRRVSNDVHIDNLGISGEHAVIVTKEDGAYIEDLNSTNGTIVNRQKIKKHMLADGDLIKLGKYKLRYLHDARINKPHHEGFQDTVLVADMPEVDDSPVVKEIASALPKQDAPVTTAEQNPIETQRSIKRPPRLQILNGNDAGATLVLDKAIVKIGRPNEQLALVTKRVQGYFLSHVLGDDYPLVNGLPIDAHAKALNNHDEIELLGVKMEFRLD